MTFDPKKSGMDVSPHVSMLIVAHTDLCSSTAKALVRCGMPKSDAQEMLAQHAAGLKAFGEYFDLQQAAADVADGVEAAARLVMSPMLEEEDV